MKLNEHTERFLNDALHLMEQGHIIWRQEWQGGYAPNNPISKHTYSGINALMLALTGFIRGYSDSRYATFKQLADSGAKVHKGSKGIFIIRPMPVYDENEDGQKELAFIRYAGVTVFNIQACSDFPLDSLASKHHEPIQDAEKIWAGYENRPTLKNGEPAYYPHADEITIPSLGQFNTPASYYATLYHEAAHSTGHEKRLARDFGAWGSEKYGIEELIAEITAGILCNVAGISQPTIENSAAYLENWLGALKNDKSMLISAASQAQKAANYILGGQADNAH